MSGTSREIATGLSALAMTPKKHLHKNYRRPTGRLFFYCLAAITAAAVAAATEATVAAAAAQQQDEDDDPPAVVTVVTTHKNTSKDFFRAALRSFHVIR